VWRQQILGGLLRPTVIKVLIQTLSLSSLSSVAIICLMLSLGQSIQPNVAHTILQVVWQGKGKAKQGQGDDDDDEGRGSFLRQLPCPALLSCPILSHSNFYLHEDNDSFSGGGASHKGGKNLEYPIDFSFLHTCASKWRMGCCAVLCCSVPASSIHSFFPNYQEGKANGFSPLCGALYMAPLR